MAFVYLLQSIKTGERYVGSTAQKPEERLADHNTGKVPWTSARRPLKLIYFEKFESLALAKNQNAFLRLEKVAMCSIRF
jgi:predicted GIY-YIG superfamily endonuclease